MPAGGARRPGTPASPTRHLALDGDERHPAFAIDQPSPPSIGRRIASTSNDFGATNAIGADCRRTASLPPGHPVKSSISP